MTSRIWSDGQRRFVGEIEESGRVWSSDLRTSVGVVQEDGRVWSDGPRSYVGKVEEDGKVWSDRSRSYVGEVQTDGRIWSAASRRFLGSVSPPDVRHGGGALLLLPASSWMDERGGGGEGGDDTEPNWPAIIFGLIAASIAGIFLALWKYRHLRGLLFLYLAVAVQFGLFVPLLAYQLHFVIAAAGAAALSVLLYRLVFSIWRWRAKEGPRVDAWAVSIILGALTMAADMVIVLAQPTFVSAAVSAYAAQDDLARATADYDHAIRVNPQDADTFKNRDEAARARTAVAPVSAPGDAADPALPTGPWWGAWTNSAGDYEYRAELSISVQPDGRASGKIVWTLVRSPRPQEQAKLGLQGVEYVEGTYDMETRAVNLAGRRRDDPHNIIGLDSYRFTISKDGRQVSGATYDHGTWGGRIDLER